MRRVFSAKKTTGLVKTSIFIACVVLLLVLIFYGLGNISAIQEEKQIEIAQDAIVKAAVQCFALESQYPPSLEYLVEHYGITLDEDKYNYHYVPIGANMVPRISVFPIAEQ